MKNKKKRQLKCIKMLCIETIREKMRENKNVNYFIIIFIYIFYHFSF